MFELVSSVEGKLPYSACILKITQTMNGLRCRGRSRAVEERLLLPQTRGMNTCGGGCPYFRWSTKRPTRSEPSPPLLLSALAFSYRIITSLARLRASMHSLPASALLQSVSCVGVEGKRNFSEIITYHRALALVVLRVIGAGIDAPIENVCPLYSPRGGERISPPPRRALLPGGAPLHISRPNSLEKGRFRSSYMQYPARCGEHRRRSSFAPQGGERRGVATVFVWSGRTAQAVPQHSRCWCCCCCCCSLHMKDRPFLRIRLSLPHTNCRA